MASFSNQTVIAFTGDSITHGLGVEGHKYSDLVGTLMDASVFNFAKSAMPIAEVKGTLDEIIACSADYIVFSHVTVEAVIRPKASALKYMPARWRKTGWMDPRPYFSKKFMKRLPQKMESNVRWRTKNMLIRLFRGATISTESDYAADLRFILSSLLNRTHSKIIVLSHFGIDDRFFPGSFASFETFSKRSKEVVEQLKNPRLIWADVSSVCEKWSDYFEDHFHPNKTGHEKIANQLVAIILGSIQKEQGLCAVAKEG
ncbi:hypothetical protein ACFSR7_04300 [Cohnella sp. GCM10020058]|uniref:hypothetical protein n=1 Tax=Cohnella sp. GCM10020058 TaxID=3317330 RepID=UPI0036302CAF